MPVVKNLPYTALKYCLYMLLATQTLVSHANVIINSTRVIYPQNQHEVSVQLTNDSHQPSLIQAWIDNGDPDATFNQISVPFILTPPIVRIEPQSGQTLWLTWTGGSLPQDRESVFWLNILDIPPKKSDSTDSNILQMAIRSRIKIFFRPPSLDEIGATGAFQSLRWQRSSASPATILTIYNPSGYFINIASITIDHHGKKIISLNGEMIAPRGSAEFKFTHLPEKINNTALHYEIFNDYGSITTVKIDKNKK